MPRVRIEANKTKMPQVIWKEVTDTGDPYITEMIKRRIETSSSFGVQADKYCYKNDEAKRKDHALGAEIRQ